MFLRNKRDISSIYLAAANLKIKVTHDYRLWPDGAQLIPPKAENIGKRSRRHILTEKTDCLVSLEKPETQTHGNDKLSVALSAEKSTLI